MKKFIILTTLSSVLLACSLSDFYRDDFDDSNKNDIVRNKNTVFKTTTCPTIIIPKETYKYIKFNKNKKSRVNIEKAKVICKEKNSESGKKLLLVDFQVNINSLANYKINYNNTKLPQIYLAIVDKKYNKVLTKIIANTNSTKILKSKENHKIINKGKFKIKHSNKLENLSLYIGFQKDLIK